MLIFSIQIQVPIKYLDQNPRTVEWKYLQKYSGKVASPNKKQNVEKQRRSRSRSSSDERKKTKSPAPKKPPPGPQTITYQLQHQQGILTVGVLECKNLKKGDFFGSVDPYVEVSVIPWALKPEKTKTLKKSQNPVFNESFQFQVDRSKLTQLLYTNFYSLGSLF